MPCSSHVLAVGIHCCCCICCCCRLFFMLLLLLFMLLFMLLLLFTSWLVALHFVFFFSFLCISRTPIRVYCSSHALALDIHCCCCICCFFMVLFMLMLMFMLLLLLFGLYKATYSLSISRFHAKTSGKCKYQGNWQIGNWPVLLKVMNGSLLNFAFFRFYSFTHTDRVQLDYYKSCLYRNQTTFNVTLF